MSNVRKNIIKDSNLTAKSIHIGDEIKTINNYYGYSENQSHAKTKQKHFDEKLLQQISTLHILCNRLSQRTEFNNTCQYQVKVNQPQVYFIPGMAEDRSEWLVERLLLTEFKKK